MTKLLKLISFICIFSSISSIFSQEILIEGFENDLSDWTIIEGHMEISGTQVFEGQGALRMHLPNDENANHILEHNTFHENFGRYHYYFFTDGGASDADLYFQYVDETHYYKVSCKPAGTDNPELLLSKGTPNGEVALAVLAPTFDQSRWFKVTVERFCDGRTHVLIDDVEQISLDDTDHMEKGKIRLRGWAENTYIDNVLFEPFSPENFVENLEICEGDSVWLGGEYRREPGTFLDTISDQAAVCTEVREVALTVQPREVIFSSIDLCPNDSIQINGQWVSEPGTFQYQMDEQGCGRFMDTEVHLLPEQAYFDTVIFCPQDGLLNYQGDFLGYIFPDGSAASQLTFEEPGNHALIGIDRNNCRQAFELTIFEVCSTSIYIPTAFSPNGDGVNDYFQIESIQSSDDVRMIIFNRWGGVIYEAATHSWDGFINGERAMTGIYLYMLWYNGELFSGSLTLMR